MSESWRTFFPFREQPPFGGGASAASPGFWRSKRQYRKPGNTGDFGRDIIEQYRYSCFPLDRLKANHGHHGTRTARVATCDRTARYRRYGASDRAALRCYFQIRHCHGQGELRSGFPGLSDALLAGHLVGLVGFEITGKNPRQPCVFVTSFQSVWFCSRQVVRSFMIV